MQTLGEILKKTTAFFKDVGQVFLLADRTIPPTLMADGIVPTEEGYRRLVNAILPDIKKLIPAP